MIEPSLSAALAVSVMLAGGAYVLPSAGLVMLTVGTMSSVVAYGKKYNGACDNVSYAHTVSNLYLAGFGLG